MQLTTRWSHCPLGVQQGPALALSPAKSRFVRHLSQAPKACSILVRGASKDVLNEVERNLHDAMGVARNVVRDPRLVPGGGACEMAVSSALREHSAGIQGILRLCIAVWAMSTAPE